MNLETTSAYLKEKQGIKILAKSPRRLMPGENNRSLCRIQLWQIFSAIFHQIDGFAFLRGTVSEAVQEKDLFWHVQSANYVI
jgi:hypothetical protein